MKKNHNIYLILLIISISFFLLVCFKLEPDTFWHIKAGEYMACHGVLRHDIFSWAVLGKYWMSHEWLFEVFLYGLRSIFGKFYVYVYSFLFCLLLLSICFLPNRENWKKNIPFGLLFLATFTVVLIPFIQARPHMISFCLLGLTIWFLYDLYRNKESKKIWFLPIVSILWANFHGGSSNLVYLLCFLFGVGGCFSFQFKKIEANRFSKKQIYTYFIVMILCMAAVCINPHGFKMFLYPYQNMMNTTMIHNITEWRGTSLSEPIHYIFYGFLLFMIGTLLVSDKKIKWIDFLLLGFSAYLGLKSIRFWIFCPIMMSFSIYDYVKSRKMDPGTTFSIGLICVFLVGLFVWNIPKLGKIEYRYFLNDDLYVVLEKEQPKRLFNIYDYGGELIYHDIPVFIDGRADYYSPYNYKDYLNISNLEEDYVSCMEKYDFDYYLVSSKFPIYTYLKYNDNYTEIYHQNRVFLYKKNS